MVLLQETAYWTKVMSILKLFITPETAYLERLVRKVLNGVRLEVFDVHARPDVAEAENILVVPMLLLSIGGSNQVLIGKFTEEQVREFLENGSIDTIPKIDTDA